MISQRAFTQVHPLFNSVQLRIPFNYGSSPGFFKALSTSRAVPRIAEKSIWTAMIPRFLRPGWRKSPDGKTIKKKERNPAIFFIVMFTLIGSQSIRMVSLRNDYDNYVRSTDAKIRLLSEVIERLKRGEEVDVKKVLGTGDEASEREWEEGKRSHSEWCEGGEDQVTGYTDLLYLVLEEIEMEDMKWSKAKDKPDPPSNETKADRLAETQPTKDEPKNKSTPSKGQFY